MPNNLDATLDAAGVQRFYDRIGRRYDLLRFAEAAPKRWALHMLAVQPGERVLEVGIGTGAVLVELARAAGPRGTAQGIERSPVMAQVARDRAQAAGVSAEVIMGDATHLPMPDSSCDAIFSSYMLDLLPFARIAQALAEMRRVARPGGRIALVALSPGHGITGHLFTAAYTALYRRHPAWLGGCRPIELTPLVAAAGFTVQQRQSWLRGHPSEAVIATR